MTQAGCADCETPSDVRHALPEGKGRGQCEDLDPGLLEKEGGLKHILARLDSQWLYDGRV